MAADETLRKLRLRPGRAAILNAPKSYQSVLSAIPKDVDVSSALRGKFDFIHLFATKKNDLTQQGAKLATAMNPDALLWISYPKGKSIETDLNRDVVRTTLESMGLKAVAQIAIDDVWSALRFKIA